MTRRSLEARDIPPSWQVDLPGDPEAPATVRIVPADETGDHRPLVDLIGSGKGVYGTPEEADAFIRELRREWRS